MNDKADPAKSRMSRAIRNWMVNLNNYPGWREWQRSKISHILHFDEELELSAALPNEFKFSSHVEIEHAVITLYLALQDTVNSLRDVEWYFRRYPFANTPVSRYAHLTYCCELFFGRFYQFRERLKNLFDAVKKAVPNHQLDVGGFIKLFDKTFEDEIRARHNVHHRERFDDVAISRVFMVESFLATSDQASWHKEHLIHYRKAAKEWAVRTRRRADEMDRFVEGVAGALLNVCMFLDAAERA